MLIWWVPGILRCERCWLGKTGQARGTCRLPLMCRAMKPKLHAFAGMQSCGGAQTQARPVLRDAVTDSIYEVIEELYERITDLLHALGWDRVARLESAPYCFSRQLC
jgi:hypothetical protein